MKIYAITGRAGAGKDTIGNYLAKNHKLSKMSFAWPIKAAMAAMLGVSMDKLEDRSYKDTKLDHLGVTPRELMQWYGKKARDEIHEDIWVMSMHHRMHGAWAEYQQAGVDVEGFVVTDLRYPNEHAYLTHVGAKILKVERPNAGLEGAAAQHESEQFIDQMNGDAVIQNTGSIADLEDVIGNVLVGLDFFASEN